MIFIAGVQPRTVRLEKHTQPCRSCEYFDVYVKRVDHYISLFFIPLIRIKKGVPFLVCENCGTHQDQRDSTFGFRETGKLQQCGFCGRSIEPDFSFCPACGKSL